MPAISRRCLILSLMLTLGISAWATITAQSDPSGETPEPSDSSPSLEAGEPLAAAASLYPGFDGYARTVTTTSEEAQQWFNQGIQLLYGYNHDEAIRSFEKAAEIDPSCAMGWWGSAYARGLHINNPVMGEEQSRLAFQAAQKALLALDDETPNEVALVRAVAQRYAWPAPQDRHPLDQAYADAMEGAWHQFPDDPDVGTLFAEALMNLQPWDLWTTKAAPKGRALEILGVLERTLAKIPQHPGANHLYIHAIEASPWPEKGTAAADRLRNLVPGSGHLVHMPSHIYIRTGRYADAVEANERAIQADETYFQFAPAPDFYSVYFLHNIHFLSYAAMMEGRYQDAMDAARKIDKQIPREFLKKNVTRVDGLMPTALHVLIRFGKWNEILSEAEPEEWQLFSGAEWHFARTIAMSALNKLPEAREQLRLFDLVADQITDEWFVGNNPAKQVLEIARNMAAGELAFREGDTEQAFKLLRQAVAQEEELRYDEPPGWMQPVRHALGALLLADNRPVEAEAVYEADLLRHPENAWSLLGLQQSLGNQGRTELADALSEKVHKAWGRADVKPVASCYCHPDALLQK